MNDITLPERVVVHHRGWYDASINEPPRWSPPHAEYIRADIAAAQLAERDARIAELEAALRDIARWRQEDQDDVEIAILQWRGCVAIARGALGVTDVTP